MSIVVVVVVVVVGLGLGFRQILRELADFSLQ